MRSGRGPARLAADIVQPPAIAVGRARPEELAPRIQDAPVHESLFFELGKLVRFANVVRELSEAGQGIAWN